MSFLNRDDGFWTKNRKKAATSAILPTFLSLIHTKIGMLMFVYMYVGFPVFLFSKYADPLVRVKGTKLLKIDHKKYSVKELFRAVTHMQNIFAASIGIAIFASFIGGFLARNSTVIPYLALHLYCLHQDAPLSVIREWLKRIRFSAPVRDPFEDSYNGIGSGTRASWWRRTHR